MGSNQQASPHIEGTVAPGFEPVQQLFEHRMRNWLEEHAQLCVYVDGQKVVDLWGSTRDNSDFGADTLVNVFSSGKSLEAIALGYLVSQGRLAYDSRVADYWPEFAQAGKDQLTVADVMRHEAGLSAFDVSLAPEQLLPDAIKANRVGEVIERHPQKYREDPTRRRDYHAVTRGWIVNEIFRRVDARGRTIGEFLAEEIHAPFGEDVHVGLKEVQLSRVAPVNPQRGYIRESLKPAFMNRGVSDSFGHLTAKLRHMVPSFRTSPARSAPPPFAGLDTMTAFNEPVIRMGETPSANAHCSARGLARLAAVMADRGSATGISLMDEAAWEAMHHEPTRSNMGIHTNFTQGGVAHFTRPEPDANVLERSLNVGREGYYGWMGLGGSLFQWHPASKVGFAFVPTSLHVLDFLNERGKAYQQEVLRCVSGG